MRTRWIFATLAATAPLLCVSFLFAQGRADNATGPQQADSATIRQALDDDAADFWIYEDVEAGFSESKRTGKPLLLSIR